MDTTFTEDVFAWLESETARLQAEGGVKQQFLDLFCDFLEAFAKNFDLAQSAILQAIKLAEAASELFWCLFLRHNLVRLWLHYDVLRLALLEAFSLLSLIGGERMRDSPHLACAYHDIVACYLLLDPAGYYKEIMANAQDVLTQVSSDHVSALAAYRSMMLASAASHHTRDAERWLAQLQSAALQYDFSCDFALACEYLERWPQAQHYYLEAARRISPDEQCATPYSMALLGVARTHCALSDSAEALALLEHLFPLLCFCATPLLLARLLVVEAHIALAQEDWTRAVSFFTQSARIYLEFAWYRESAHCALQAAELARSVSLPEAAQALSFASQAARMLPPASHDILQRLAAFSRYPSSPSSESLFSAGSITQDILEERELAVLKTSLRVSIAAGHLPLISLLLFLLARAHLEQSRDFHLVVSYLVWHIVLERFHASSLSLNNSLSLLSTLRDEYDQTDEVDETLFALAASPPPDWLTWFCEGLSSACWRACVMSLLHFLTGDADASQSWGVPAGGK